MSPTTKRRTELVSPAVRALAEGVLDQAARAVAQAHPVLETAPTDLLRAGWRWEAGAQGARLANAAEGLHSGWWPIDAPDGAISEARAVVARDAAIVAAEPTSLAMATPENGLPQFLPKMQRHVDRTLAADRKGGEALWEKALAVADARADAQHGEWGRYLAATGLEERAARRLIAIAERGRTEERFRTAIISGWLTFSVGAIAAQADDDLLVSLLAQPEPPTREQTLAIKSGTGAGFEDTQLPPTAPALAVRPDNVARSLPPAGGAPPAPPPRPATFAPEEIIASVRACLARLRPHDADPLIAALPTKAERAHWNEIAWRVRHASAASSPELRDHHVAGIVDAELRAALVAHYAAAGPATPAPAAAPVIERGPYAHLKSCLDCGTTAFLLQKLVDGNLVWLCESHMATRGFVFDPAALSMADRARRLGGELECRIAPRRSGVPDAYVLRLPGGEQEFSISKSQPSAALVRVGEVLAAREEAARAADAAPPLDVPAAFVGIRAVGAAQEAADRIEPTDTGALELRLIAAGERIIAALSEAECRILAVLLCFPEEAERALTASLIAVRAGFGAIIRSTATGTIGPEDAVRVRALLDQVEAAPHAKAAD